MLCKESVEPPACVHQRAAEVDANQPTVPLGAQKEVLILVR